LLQLCLKGPYMYSTTTVMYTKRNPDYATVGLVWIYFFDIFF
jgi:hypothetical protein